MSPVLIGFLVCIGAFFIVGRSVKAIYSGYAFILLFAASVPLIIGNLSGSLVSILCIACMYEMHGIRTVFNSERRYISSSGLIITGIFLYFVYRINTMQRWHEALVQKSGDTRLLPIAMLAAGILVLRTYQGIPRE